MHSTSAIPLQRLPGKKKSPHKKFDMVRWGKFTNEYDFSKPHRHNYFEILIFFKGGGLHEIDFTQYPIKNHSIHFVPANSVHLLRRAKTSDGATILFSEDLFYSDQAYHIFFKNLSFYTGSKGQVLSLSKYEFTFFESLYNELLDEFEKEAALSEIIFKSLLALFLAKAERQFNELNPEQKSTPGKNTILEAYKLLVEKNFLNHCSVHEYAEMLHVSPKHLNDLCKQHLSVTAQKVIHERLLLEIKRLLVHTDISVKEVCFQTGFEDPAHFNHFFRFHLNLTPMQYRKSTR